MHFPFTPNKSGSGNPRWCHRDWGSAFSPTFYFQGHLLDKAGCWSCLVPGSNKEEGTKTGSSLLRKVPASPTEQFGLHLIGYCLVTWSHLTQGSLGKVLREKQGFVPKEQGENRCWSRQPPISATDPDLSPHPEGAGIAISTFFIAQHNFYCKADGTPPYCVCLILGWLLKCPAMVGNVRPEVLCPCRCPQDIRLSHLSLTFGCLVCVYAALGPLLDCPQGSGIDLLLLWLLGTRQSAKESFHLLLGSSNLSLVLLYHPPKEVGVQGLAFRDSPNCFIFHYLSSASLSQPVPQGNITIWRAQTLFLVFLFLLSGCKLLGRKSQTHGFFLLSTPSRSSLEMTSTGFGLTAGNKKENIRKLK